MVHRIAILAAASAATVAAQQCHDYVLISIRGTTELQGPSVGFKGMIKQILDTVPNGVEYDAVYPADAHFRADIGGEDARRYVTTGLRSCPNQKYAWLGYSQGATATAIGLRSMMQNNETQAIDAVKGILVIGNPGHVPNASANVDQFGGKTTSDYEGSFYFNGAGSIPELFYQQDKVLDICEQGDSICAPAYPNASFIPNHLLYAGDQHVQDMGAQFLKSKLTGSQAVAPVMPSSSAMAVPSFMPAVPTSAQMPTASTTTTPTSVQMPTSSMTTTPTASTAPAQHTGAAAALRPSWAALSWVGAGAWAGLALM